MRSGILLAGLVAAATLGPAGPAAAGQSSTRPSASARQAQAAPTRTTHARHHARRSRSRVSADDAAYDDTMTTPAPMAETVGSPRAACLAAARHAEQAHGLPPGLMVAIALSESGLHAHALNIRGRAYFPEDRATARALLARAGGRAFAGCVQVNTAAHARGSDWPLDAERATDWAGTLLANAYAETGSWTAALARFHGGSPAGTRRVICRVRAKLEVAAPASPVLQEVACGGNEIARVRRSGAALLEIAEAQ